MSITSDSGFLVLLTAHLVRSEALIEKALNILAPEDFDQVGERGFMILWAISKEWFSTHNKPIPRAYMDIAIKDRLSENFGEFTADGVAEVNELLTLVYAAPEDVLIPQEMTKQLQLFLDDRKLRPITAAMSTAGTGPEFNELLEQLDEQRRASRVSTVTTHSNIFTPEGITFKNTERTPTGVGFVDEVLGGGPARGEVYGLMGPTGGGKTTAATMILDSVARGRRHAAFFSYETELVPQVSNKIYGIAGDIPRESLKNLKSVDDLPTSDSSRLKESMALYGEFMHPCDMKCDAIHGTGGGGVPEIRAQLKKFHDEGHHIDILIIDQLLSMVDSQILAKNLDLNLRRQYMQLAIEQLREVVQSSDMNCSAFVLHQVDNAVKNASSTREPRKGDAAEDKSFDNNLHFCMQFGVMDKAGRCWFGTPKAREDGEKLLILEIDRKYWRFNYEKDKFIHTQRGGFMLNDANDEHALPSEADVDRGRRKPDLDDAEIG